MGIGCRIQLVLQDSTISVTSWERGQVGHESGTKTVLYQHFGLRNASSTRSNDVFNGDETFFAEEAMERFMIIAKVEEAGAQGIYSLGTGRTIAKFSNVKLYGIVVLKLEL